MTHTHRHARRHTPLLPRLSLLLPALVIAVLTSACDHERVHVEYPVMVVGIVDDAPNKRGWTVEFEQAHARLGPMRFYEGKPLFSRVIDTLPSVIRTAHAHPGHYDPSEALGELLETKEIDLLAEEPTLLGVASAYTGAYGSAELSLPESGAGDFVGEASIRVHGTATDEDGVVVRFEAAVPIDHAVTGLPFEHVIEGPGGHVRIDVRLSRWFENVDFDTVSTDESDEGRRPFNEGSQAFNALVRGASNGAAYGLTWVAGARP